MIPPCAQNVLLSSGCDDLVSSVTSTLRLAAAHAAAHPASPLPMIRLSVLMSVPFYRYDAPPQGEYARSPLLVEPSQASCYREEPHHPPTVTPPAILQWWSPPLQAKLRGP